NKGNKIYQSSFIGYFPAEDPQYTIAVVIQNSDASKLAYGGVVSAPVFKEVADRIHAANIKKLPHHISLPSNDTSAYAYTGAQTDLNMILRMLGFPSTDSAIAGYWRSMVISRNTATLNKIEFPTVRANSTPPVIGLGLKDAVYLLENLGLQVNATGRGKIVYQSLPAGTRFSKGQIIAIQLN
ncbi:MAG: PASTA domain-containing protein, partial [Chitinophagaceae bacterium]